MEDLLAPDRIRIIRQGLGLTQREAGELLGGGPNAFAKYETGRVTPSTALANLLKVLEGPSGSLRRSPSQTCRPYPNCAATSV